MAHIVGIFDERKEERFKKLIDAYLLSKGPKALFSSKDIKSYIPIFSKEDGLNEEDTLLLLSTLTMDLKFLFLDETIYGDLILSLLKKIKPHLGLTVYVVVTHFSEEMLELIDEFHIGEITNPKLKDMLKERGVL